MTHHKHNLTAIIYDKRNRILSIGKNSYSKSHPLQADFAVSSGHPEKIFLHAEIDALIRLRERRTEAKRIHIIRIGRDGKERNAKPCAVCMNALIAFGITKITHT